MFIEQLQELSTARLINLRGDVKLINEAPFNPFKTAALSGDIHNDRHERWPDGKWVVTSNIKKFHVSETVCYAQTASMSLYELEVDEAEVRKMVADRPDLDIPIERIEF